MDKTTLYLDSEDYRRLKRVAYRRRVAPAILVREAIADYVARHDTVRAARSVGAARCGRAEDIFAGFVIDAGRQWSIKAGYRFLEGGADNDEVYTFAAVHYVAAGVVFRF